MVNVEFRIFFLKRHTKEFRILQSIDGILLKSIGLLYRKEKFCNYLKNEVMRELKVCQNSSRKHKIAVWTWLAHR